jgi:hypothetical protein
MKNAAFIIVLALALSGCTITINQENTPNIPENQNISLNEISKVADLIEMETVVHNNCNGTAEVQQSAEKSQDIQIDIAVDLGMNYEIIKSTVYSRYSESSSNSKSINLPVPARTRMEYTIKWTQESFEGIIVSKIRPEIGTYRVNRPVRVELVQSIDLGCDSARGSIKSISLDNGQGGLVIHTEVFVENRMHTEVEATAYFQHPDGTPLRDSNEEYNTINGDVAAFTRFRPDRENQSLRVDIFIPWDELHISTYGETNLRVVVALWDIWDTSKPATQFAVSDYHEFIFILNPPTPTPDACFNSLPSNLSVGMIAIVNTQNPAPNRIRSFPGGEVIGRVEAGRSVEIIGGPVCSNGLRWWNVTALDTQLSGWTAEGDAVEYWLIPGP